MSLIKCYSGVIDSLKFHFNFQIEVISVITIHRVIVTASLIKFI